MNRMIGTGDFFTSSINPFRRFSNSPFTPAPACSSARSSVRSVTPRNGGGTSPSAMRRANPSTTAVLPTPASPTRIGLFCRRRVRMSTTCRTSASRPSTGSILPARAFAVRSTVYCSRNGVGPPALAPAPTLAPVPGVIGPPLEANCARDSLLSTTIASNVVRNDSAFTVPSDGSSCTIRRAMSSSSTSASNTWPVRIFCAPNSTDPIVHACVRIFTSDGASVGVRALPVFSRSRARCSSVARRERSTPKCRSAKKRSVSVVSSAFSSRCSISMS